MQIWVDSNWSVLLRCRLRVERLRSQGGLLNLRYGRRASGELAATLLPNGEGLIVSSLLSGTRYNRRGTLSSMPPP